VGAVLQLIDQHLLSIGVRLRAVAQVRATIGG
jgi:hypothetical protein